jgi:mannose-6-phosphate isomerase-like protein (cupin superfamily)
MEKINLGERLFRALGSKPSAPTPVALVDDDYWVYIVRYQGECGTQQNEKDMFCLLLEGTLEVEMEDEHLSLEKGEAFLAKGGTRWRPVAEGRGAVALQFESRRKRSFGEADAMDLDVM